MPPHDDAGLRRSIGKNIKRLRELRQMSQPELAEKAEVSGAPMVSRWESGSSMPSASKLHLIAEVLRVSADDLLGRRPVRSDVEEAFEKILEVVDGYRAGREPALRVAEDRRGEYRDDRRAAE